MKRLGAYKRPVLYGLAIAAFGLGIYFDYDNIAANNSYALPCLFLGIIFITFAIYRSKKNIFAGEFISTGHEGFGINENEERPVRISWDQLKEVRWNPDADFLVFIYKSKDSVDIYSSVTGYRKLLDAIPQELCSAGVLDARKLYRNMETCAICGRIAVVQIVTGDEHFKTCKVCANDAWSNSLKKNFGSEQNYIRDMQAEYFCYIESEEGFYHANEDSGFALDPNWKPSISLEEALAGTPKDEDTNAQS
ncbi:MAG: hypothetical protein FD123_3751 [Bacteroidetes bacterium]|nr:MAG: hypothetical protein FD123_3751 [Bacteroidota bacterium]